MKVGKFLLFLLVAVLVLGFAFVVFGGVSFGMYTFKPVDAVKLGLDLTGGVSIEYMAEDSANVEDLDTKIQGAMNIFRTRLDERGFNEATIVKQGTDRIRVEVPINDTSDIKDPNEIVQFIGEPAHLEFVAPTGEVLFEGSAIESASAAYDEFGQPAVAFQLNAEASDIFAKATQEYYNPDSSQAQSISITLDGVVISSPTVTSVIAGGSGQITGMESAEAAQQLAMQIESGALPLDLSAINQETLSATLGDEALENGVLGGLIGLAILLVFMLVFYRLPGLAADLALIFYVSLVVFMLALFEIQLTLPGIAGIILGIGMAVDANVIIFARFKEEHRSGKSIRSALKGGFKKATRAITDSNITTLIAAFVLAMFGTGSIQGFAYTLAVSIIVSMLSALVVTQGLLRLLTGSFPGAKGIFLSQKFAKRGEK